MFDAIIAYTVYFISILSQLLFWCIFIWVIMSWFSARDSNFAQILGQVVEPVIKPFSWAKIGMIDLSPIVAMLVIDYGGRVLVNGLMML